MLTTPSTSPHTPQETHPLSSDYLARFAGIGRLYGVQALQRLAHAHVCVFGIGGVGSWSVEALARSGVGRLTLVDLDDVCVSNMNRQLHTLTQTVGRFKVEVMAERALAINPELKVHTYTEFFTPKTAEHLLNPEAEGRPAYNAVIDAIDHTSRKALLIAACYKRGLPIAVSGAAGGRSNPTLVRHSDLTSATHDGLLRQVRRLLKREHHLPAQGPWGVEAVFSIERPVYPTPEGGVCDTPPQEGALNLGCEWGFGAATHLTATFGFTAAHLALQALLTPPQEHT